MRAKWISLVVLMLVAVIGPVAGERDPIAVVEVERLARRGLADLGRLAGLQTASGDAVGSGLPVTVVQHGGPLWVTGAVEAAARATPGYVLRDSPHLLSAQLVSDGRAYALGLSLVRRGWGLEGPRPHRIQVAPEVVTWSVAAGALVLLGLRRVWLAVGIAAFGAQLAVTILGWSDPHPPQGWSAAIVEGPLVAAVEELARALPASFTAIAGGLVTLCVVLMVFDHRRAKRDGVKTLAEGVWVVLATVIWTEAALRAGMIGTCASLAGMVWMGAGLAVWPIAGALGSDLRTAPSGAEKQSQ